MSGSKYQALGMVGLFKSVKQGRGWLKSLYFGPIRKKTAVPKQHLPVVPADAKLGTQSI